MKIFTIERIFILLALSLALIAAVPNVIINQDAQIAGIQSMPAGFSYLTTSTCAGGYTAVEDGFIQLGSSPSTTPSGSNSKQFLRIIFRYTHMQAVDLLGINLGCRQCLVVLILILEVRCMLNLRHRQET